MNDTHHEQTLSYAKARQAVQRADEAARTRGTLAMLGRRCVFSRVTKGAEGENEFLPL